MEAVEAQQQLPHRRCGCSGAAAASRRARVVGCHLAPTTNLTAGAEPQCPSSSSSWARLAPSVCSTAKSSSSWTPLPPVLSAEMGPGVAEAEVVVVGAGIAGSALAHALGHDGRRVVLIERDLREPNRIVGELLQPGGLAALTQLGLQDCVKDIDGVEVHGYAIMSGQQCSDVVALPYPPLDNGAQPKGVSFHHGRFIMQLRRAAHRAPNVRVVEGTVTKLLKETRQGEETVIGVEYKTKSGLKEVRAALTVVCDGCFSRFRDELDEAKPGGVSKFVGVVMEGAPLLHPNHGHVFLIEPSPALAYQISSVDTRMLIDVPDSAKVSAKELPNYLRTVTAPQLPEKVREAFLRAIEVGQIRSMPNSKLHPRPFRWPNGVIFVGDCYNMRHPLTGGGMSVAFNDVLIIRNVLRPIKDLANARAIGNAIKEWHSLRYPTASTVNILSHCLYTLFASGPGTTLGPMRDACMAYFKLGGACASGPMNLLAITKAKPWILMMHFFLVALYGTTYALAPFPSPARIWSAAKVLLAASGVFFPVAKEEQMFHLFFNHVLTFPYHPVLPHPSAPFASGPYPLGLNF